MHLFDLLHSFLISAAFCLLRPVIMQTKIVKLVPYSPSKWAILKNASLAFSPSSCEAEAKRYLWSNPGSYIEFQDKHNYVKEALIEN